MSEALPPCTHPTGKYFFILKTYNIKGKELDWILDLPECIHCHYKFYRLEGVSTEDANN